MDDGNLKKRKAYCNRFSSQMEEGEGGFESGTSFCDSPAIVKVIQKVFAELIGTYFLIFAGCCSVILNNSEKTKGQITFPGICIVWGSTVMILVYALAHVSGAHFNPAVTISFAIHSSFLASGTLYLLFKPDANSYFGTVPAGAHSESLVLELLTSFLLMFVVSAVSTDKRANGKFGGVVVGMTIIVDVFIAGPVSGASMNPARSLGPALVMGIYNGFWIYVVGPFVGAILGATCYNLIRYTDKPLRDIGSGAKIVNGVSISTFR
ncbi:unnamed protein product [Sphenostylis stenocarpa]|uniref:Aquaporin n=1 Tax=Sphenostylis stenocarpa TaxID=92480 RepID=A0AA86VXF0_9FABA|nr:unnamed protein product [Sphenostylis stenocarpa]